VPAATVRAGCDGSAPALRAGRSPGTRLAGARASRGARAPPFAPHSRQVPLALVPLAHGTRALSRGPAPSLASRVLIGRNPAADARRTSDLGRN